ncbi:serine/threonine-protein kinase [Frankia sp. CcI49]|uniref:serine/threonine-protein kinase n=1 Tax=Frankia sp. CcI49 TaxID=1745382 RepID=UPI0009FEA2FB|nr:serine/threonine-protein kinase [Frankia sp. CcI49]
MTPRRRISQPITVLSVFPKPHPCTTIQCGGCYLFFDREQAQAALPNYQLGRPLGSGRFGFVVAGRHRNLDRPVAIKTILLDDAVDGDLAREARVIAGVDHPHVVRVYDYVERDDVAYIVMELLSGGSLREWSRRGSVTPAAVCAVGVALAWALDDVHASGVLHRDIKPANILFAADRAPKLTDFGIAKVLAAAHATASRIIGSTPYMAPEQYTLGRLAPATDVYALGAVLYELLAGRPPFLAPPESQRISEEHVFGPVPPLSGAPAPVADVILRALSKEARDRQSTAGMFAEELMSAAGDALGADWADSAGITVRVPDLHRAVPDPLSRTIREQDTRETVRVARDGRRADPASGDRAFQPYPGRRWAYTLTGLLAVITAVITLVAAVWPPGRPEPWSTTRSVRLIGAVALAVDPGGNLLLTDQVKGTLIRVTPQEDFETIIGIQDSDEPSRGLAEGEPGSWREASSAHLNGPTGVAATSDGAIFVADAGNCVVRVVRKIGKSWSTNTIAGDGRTSESDGCTDRGAEPGRNLQLRRTADIGTPTDVAVDADDNLYIATGPAGQVWKLRRTTGEWSERIPYASTLELVAGTMYAGPESNESLDGFDGETSATDADLDHVFSLAVSQSGNIWLLSKMNREKTPLGTDRLHLVEPDGSIRTVLSWPPGREIRDLGAAGNDPSAVLATERGDGMIYTVSASGEAEVWRVGRACSQLNGLARDNQGDLFLSCSSDLADGGSYVLLARPEEKGTPNSPTRILT